MLNSKSYQLTSFVLYTVLNSLINSLALCCTQQYPLTGVSSLWCPFLLANSTSTYFNLKTKTYLSLYTCMYSVLVYYWKSGWSFMVFFCTNFLLLYQITVSYMYGYKHFCVFISSVCLCSKSCTNGLYLLSC